MLGVNDRGSSEVSIVVVATICIECSEEVFLCLYERVVGYYEVNGGFFISVVVFLQLMVQVNIGTY